MLFMTFIRLTSVAKYCELNIVLCFKKSSISGEDLVRINVLKPPVASATVRSNVVVLLLLIKC